MDYLLYVNMQAKMRSRFPYWQCVGGNERLSRVLRKARKRGGQWVIRRVARDGSEIRIAWSKGV